MSAIAPWYRRRRWSLGLVLLVIVLAGVAYEWVSSAPVGVQVGSCTIVSGPKPDHRSDCAGADLSRRDLAGRDLRLADLSGADLAGADLRGAVLYGADLTGADLRATDLSEADLTGADLTGATLARTRFTGASIDGMNITRTVLGARSRSVWSGDDEPALLTWSSTPMPGIRSDDCSAREGLFYPGQNAVTCTVTTDALYGGSLQYGISMEVKRAPTISAPTSVELHVGSAADVPVRAESPWPAVTTTIRGRLPQGVSYDAGAQRLTGVPSETSSGRYDVTILAENGRRTRQTLSIVVTG